MAAAKPMQPTQDAGVYISSTQKFAGEKAPERTANRGGGSGGMQNVGNSIGDIPSVKLYAPPGGASSFGVSTGATIY